MAQAGKPQVSGEVSKAGNGVVDSADCLVAKERVTECDVACPLGLPTPKTVTGHEVRRTECGRSDTDVVKFFFYPLENYLAYFIGGA